MSLLGEELVEEWLNRKGYFTIRGAKIGNGEIDLLAVKYTSKGIDCWHYEVQASLRPVSYICSAPQELRKLGKSAHNAKKRPMSEIETAAKEWIYKKYLDPKKENIRRSLWPMKWSFGLIVGNVKHSEELEIIAKNNITIVRIADIIKNLSPKSQTNSKDFRVGAASGADLIDLVFAHSQLA
ncbi:MAG: hypothetical protein NTY76_07550 [Candidatus Omnitrophica bacterium]|nr:hypothetical protein [Candidatus Omnitrophota bacterium]